MADAREDRIHRAVSADGTELAGLVRGNGPPLVLLPAGPADSETAWCHLLPRLSERFTCYLLDTRGRGRSAEHPDHSPVRLVEDITAFAESVGEPVGLVEWASFIGPALSLVAARRTDAVNAVATYEPLVFEVASEADVAHIEGATKRVAKLAAEGRLADAGQSFVESLAEHGYYTDEDMAGGATSKLWATSATNIPMFLGELREAKEAEGPSPAGPSQLAEVAVPVLLLYGGRTHPGHIGFLRHVADHVADPVVREIAGAGHYGPHTEPAAVARELVRFFEGVWQPVSSSPA